MTLMIRTPQHVRIAGMGTAFPPLTLNNEAVLAQLAGEGPRGRRSPSDVTQLAMALAETLGVQQRSWSHRVGEPLPSERATSATLQTTALREALEAANLPGHDLAALITASSTPERIGGANAPTVALAAGAHGAAFDVRAGCAGGLVALVQGCILAATCQKPVAVAAGDVFSQILPADPLAGLAVGDGAAAAILQPAADSALLGAALQADGSLAHLAGAQAPFPPTAEAVAEGAYVLRGESAALAEVAVSHTCTAIQLALECAGVSLDDVHLIIPHQASRTVHRNLLKQLQLPAERLFSEVHTHANIGSASMLVALHDALVQGRAQRGQIVVLTALGGGLSWGAAVVRL